MSDNTSTSNTNPRELWLVPTLGSFLPIAFGFLTPDRFHTLLLGLSGAMLLVGFLILLRHGITRVDADVMAPREEKARQAA